MILKSKDEYLTYFQGDKREKALEQAWKNRDFEIQLYWKRATYFWVFIASLFTAYLATKSFKVPDDSLIVSILILGLLFSICWVLVNIGSKKWQENWEYHIDLLEDDITGPIYKTALVRWAPSVSKVNLFVSIIVSIMWIVLLVKKLSTMFPIVEFIVENWCLIIASALVLSVILYLIGTHKKIKSFLTKSNSYYFEYRETRYESRQ